MTQDIDDIHYENQIVAFVDILGFKEIIKQSESDLEKLKLIYQALEFLQRQEKVGKWNLDLIEVEDDAQKKGISKFEIQSKTSCTCFSDSIVVSVKVDENNINEMTSTLIANLSYIGAQLMAEGIILRGGITIGKLIHLENGLIMGQALIEAYQLESNSAKYPRILVSKKLISNLNYPIDTKKNRYPYHQYLQRFEDGCVGFHQMKYFEVIGSSDLQNQYNIKDKLIKIRKTIISGLDDHFESADTYDKYIWLKKEYDKLIILSNEKLKIYEINEGIPGQNIHYSYTNDFYDENSIE